MVRMWSVPALCEFALVSPAEVEKLLKGLNPSKASGPDNISSAELKLSAKCIAGKIATIFNESLRSGDLPTEFKIGHVIPLLKPGKTDTTNPASYRAITLTPVLSKVLERVVHNQVTAFLNETAALNDQQYGFRKGYSCVDLMTVAVDDWLLARDQKLSTAIAFLDLSIRLLTMSTISSCSYFFKGSTLVGQCFGGFRTTSLEGLTEL